MAPVRIVAVVLSGTVVFASDGWLDRPFETWTPQETRSVLRDSPWAGTARVRVDVRGGGFSRPWTLKAHAVWSSALPVRQAEWRRRNPKAHDVSDADLAALAVVPAGYLISVSLDGADLVSMLASDGDRGLLSAVLRQGNLVIPAVSTRGGWLNEASEIERALRAPERHERQQLALL